MSQTNIEGGSLRDIPVVRGFKLASRVITLAADLTLSEKDAPVLIIDPGGASRNILLPAEASSVDLVFIIVNTADAAEDLVVKEDSGVTTIATVNGSVGGTANQRGIFHCDGTNWRAIVAGMD